jgi:ABC-2 type transport system ATP-binding protein
MDAPTLSVSGLSVERGGRTIIDGLSLQLRPGEVYALLGGNGSGKSTTLYAILGLLPRQAGELTVNGRDPAREPDAVRASVAYLPENVALYDHLTARENIGYFLEIAGVQRSRDDVAEAFRSVRLDESTWDRRAGGFSKGMRQKTAIALAILRGAPLLLLDEPTSGLDPSASRDFHTLIEDLGRRERSISRSSPLAMVQTRFMPLPRSRQSLGATPPDHSAGRWAPPSIRARCGHGR